MALARAPRVNHIPTMSKLPKPTGQSAKIRKTAKGAKVLGTTFDGVRVLRPKGKATHFTAKELQAAIASVRAARSGR
jgi:cytochrome c5